MSPRPEADDLMFAAPDPAPVDSAPADAPVDDNAVVPQDPADAKLSDLLKQARAAADAGDEAGADALYAQIAALEGSVQ